VETEASADAILHTDVMYIKSGVDDIRADVRAQGPKVEDLSIRVAKVEESAKQAHKRIDCFESES
jgi:hypothetical protein